MRGRLIMNGFVDTPKFNRLREFIFGSATKYGIELEYFPTTALAYALGDDFSQTAIVPTSYCSGIRT